MDTIITYKWQLLVSRCICVTYVDCFCMYSRNLSSAHHHFRRLVTRGQRCKRPSALAVPGGRLTSPEAEAGLAPTEGPEASHTVHSLTVCERLGDSLVRGLPCRTYRAD